jgi:rare lipoprotein A
MNSKFESLFRAIAVSVMLLSLVSCHKRIDRSFRDQPFDGSSQVGNASWYGDKFHGRKTSSGETYDMYAMTAAHRTAPFGTNVRVTNMENGKQTVVSVNDRGPFVRGRIIDLSKKAAQEIDMIGTGTAKVKLEFMDRRPIQQTGETFIQAGSFGSDSNAQTHLLRLQQVNSRLSARIYKEKGLYRVRLGPYASDDSAQTDLDQLKRSGFDGFILHLE